ncbi:hypothetical protein ACF1A5_07465 [Streptomyces sp. NPDC014864]|uniref:hypothetical protein n=1 Tax=Streptomyces sp. NPDC014864 TaxID=3364924 RepID=UPI0036FD5F60
MAGDDTTKRSGSLSRPSSRRVARKVPPWQWAGSGERPALRSLALLPACTAVLCAVALATAVSAAPAAVRTPLAWGAGVAAVVLVAAVLAAVHAR